MPRSSWELTRLASAKMSARRLRLLSRSHTGRKVIAGRVATLAFRFFDAAHLRAVRFTGRRAHTPRRGRHGVGLRSHPRPGRARSIPCAVRCVGSIGIDCLLRRRIGGRRRVRGRSGRRLRWTGRRCCLRWRSRWRLGRRRLTHRSLSSRLRCGRLTRRSGITRRRSRLTLRSRRAAAHQRNTCRHHQILPTHEAHRSSQSCYFNDTAAACVPFRNSSSAACSSRSNGNGPCATMKS
jgi:hypothetical protein